MAEESGPRPGHFLPKADQPDESPKADRPDEPPKADRPNELPKDRRSSELPKYGRPGVPGYGAPSEPLAAPTPRLGRGAEKADGPPLLSGSRLGPPPQGDRAAAAFRARYQPEPIPFEPKQKSKALIAGLVAGALVLAGGAVFGATKVLASYDDFVANPLGTPSVKQPGTQSDQQPSDQQPTAEPTPDVVVLLENKLYSAGKPAPVSCREPAFRPTSKGNVKAYYQALLVCMNKFWEPVVRKSGHEFHPPKLIMFDENRSLARIDMAGALGYVYGVHVQNLTGILESSTRRQAEAATPALKLEQTRRSALQAACLSSVFLGAERATFPVTGDLLTWWKWRSKHGGDDSDPRKVGDHGSDKSVELWMNKGFSAPDPGSCNTFVAAAAKVS
ncbi:neutral zinc metallopeptidase [Kribbella sp. NPDC023855]|uniref:neutral zinc metallopeptidase n=1 Tax=Kribbella sp. NPDC023855 TaxID=3154698 RepID=UPI0033F7101F